MFIFDLMVDYKNLLIKVALILLLVALLFLVPLKNLPTSFLLSSDKTTIQWLQDNIYLLYGLFWLTAIIFIPLTIYKTFK